MLTVKVILLLIFAALGFYILVRIHKSNSEYWERKIREIMAFNIELVKLPPETEWFASDFVPFNHGLYRVRRKFKFKSVAKFKGEEYMRDACIWNGKEWLSTDGRPSFFQDWEFKGLTQKVTA